MKDIEKAIAKVGEILKKYNIETEKELQRELRENAINIAIFTQPIKKKTN